jgi:UDP-glucose 4-epimerase
MRIFLTGGSGFIGSHLLPVLSNHEVVALSRTPLPTLDHVTNVVCDLADVATIRTAMDGCDAVLHLAAVSNAGVAAADPGRCVDTNVTATARLAHLAAAAGVQRFVFSSSALVYGSAPTVPITEETPPAPVGVYAQSKLAAERLLTEIHPAALVLRVFNVFGPRQTGTLVPALIEKMLNDDEVTLQGDGSQIRSFLYAADAADAMRRAVESSHTGVLNVAGHKASVLDVLNAIAAACGTEVSPLFGPAREGDAKENWASLDAIGEVLGWAPAVSLDEGIARTVDAARR